MNFFMMRKSIHRILFVAAFIVFLIIVIPWLLFSVAYVESNMSVDTKTSVQETRIAGLFIEFENRTAEPEVKAILENCNMTMNYSINYNAFNLMEKRYYLKIDKDKRMDIKDELDKEGNWTDPIFPDIQKGNYYIITVTEQAIHDKKFLAVLEKNNIQVKNSVLCYIHFGDESRYWILAPDAIRIQNKLEMNEKVLSVSPDYLIGPNNVPESLCELD